MTRRAKVLYSLSRKRIRASLNKYNLYNAITWRKANRFGTLYQQRFLAKQETRSYHGENLTETQYRNVFTGKLNAVSSLQSRRSGVTEKATPWALQTFVALERRLDTAVFRAMFASSIRQAAQFILQGCVKVNGVKIRHPSFTLSPGDIFSVEPDKVLLALGRNKPSVKESVELLNRQIKRYNKYLKRCRQKPEYMFKVRMANRRRHKVYYEKYMKGIKEKASKVRKELMTEMNKKVDQVSPVSILEAILRRQPIFEKFGELKLFDNNKTLALKSLSVYNMVQGRLSEQSTAAEIESEKNGNDDNEVSAEAVEKSANVDETKVDELNPDSAVTAAAKLDQVSDTIPDSLPEELDSAQVQSLVKKYFPPKSSEEAVELAGNRSDVKKLLKEIVDLQRNDIRKDYSKKIELVEKSEDVYDPKWIDNLPEKIPLLNAEEIVEDPTKVPKLALPFSSGGLYGRQDPSKPYFTPWTPRQFLAPFSILPHHIEISFLSCHASYMRDPVARPGQSELISPFPLDMHERVHMWYSRKRRKYIQ